MNTTTLLELDHVSFSYDGIKPALSDVSLTVAPGEIVALIGPNGSGKSTLIKLMFDLLRLRTGSMTIGGHPQRSPAARRLAQYLSSNDHLPEFLRASEYLRVISQLYGEPLNQPAAELFFEQYGMGGRIHHLLEDFSHGMRKKTQLISAFLQRRPLTVIDETLNGIDVEALHLVERELTAMAAEGNAILVCSHDFSMLERIAHRVIFLDYGRIVMTDSVGTIRAHSGSVADMVFAHLDARNPA